MKLLPLLLFFGFFSSCTLLQKNGFETRRYRSGFYHASSSSGSHPKNKATINTLRDRTDHEVVQEQSAVAPGTKANTGLPTPACIEVKTGTPEVAVPPKPCQQFPAKKHSRAVTENAFHRLPLQTGKNHTITTSVTTGSDLFSGLTLEESLWMLAFLVLTYAFAFLLTILFPGIGTILAIVLGGCLSLGTIIGFVILIS